MIKKILLNIRDYFMESDETPEIYLHDIFDWGALGFVYGLVIAFFIKYNILQLYYSFPNVLPLGCFLGFGIGGTYAYLLNRSLEKSFRGLHTINFHQKLRSRSSRLFNKSYLPYLVLALSICGYLLYSSFIRTTLNKALNSNFESYLYFQPVKMLLLFLGLLGFYGGSALFLMLVYRHKLIQENISRKIGKKV